MASNSRNENAPASGSGSVASGPVEAISSFAQSVFSKENLESVSRAAQEAKDQAIELKNQAQTGDNSLRAIAFLGGILLVIVAFYEILKEAWDLNIIGALVEIYTLGIGIVVIILEGRHTFLSEEFLARVHKYALFLKFLWGRGCLYIFCGTLVLYQLDLLNLICGAYMCFVGILFIVIGQRTAYKLRTLRKTLFSEEMLRQKFAMADIDGDNSLDLQQFRSLTMSLGLDLTRRETEAAFNHIHKSQTEKLTFEEFQVWWTKTDAQQEVDENAFVFV